MALRRDWIAVFCFAVLALSSGCATAPAKESQAPSISAAVAAYGAAWASRDVDRIVALHTEDTEFTLFVDGMETARGREGVRQQFAWVLQTNPTYSSRTVSVEMSQSAATIEYVIVMDPQAPFRMGRWQFTPNGAAYDVRAIDVLYFENGLVKAKHTYIDLDAVRRNSRAAVPAP